MPASTWCARCGRTPQVPGLHICQRCFEDPSARLEVEWGMRESRTTGQDARYLVKRKFHWVGGWPRP